MADPRTLLAGRFTYAGALKNSQALERWVGVDSDTGRRVVLAVADSGRLSVLDTARGVKHRHLASVLVVARELDGFILPGGKALPPGFGVAIAEFVPGTTLHSELLKGPMSPAKAVAWVLRLADAVQALHAAGAVHGALSPRSVIAVPSGRAIAPVLSQLVALPIGPFCPPERLKGAVEVPADDVWALHAALYAALTRQTPFSAPTSDALLKQMSAARPKPLSAFGVDEPVLQELIERGLAYERRARASELADLVRSLDGWERDPRVMPLKRPVPPRASPRSFIDIVGAAGLARDRDVRIVIDGGTLPDDDGSEVDPKPASSATAAPPPVLTTPPEPTPQSRAAPRSVSASPASFSPSAVGQLKQRISINPFERKRSVWPLVVVAAAAGGGGVYLAVAPDAAPPAAHGARTSSTARAPEPKAAPPERLKVGPIATRDACVASYFEPGTPLENRDFAFLCQDGDFREAARRLQRLALPSMPQGLDAAAPVTGPSHAESVGSTSGLDWYELPAAAIMRKSCCDAATPVVLPETPGWCEQLQTVVRRIAEDSGKAGDLAPDARSFEKAVACLFANQVPRSYAYEKAPTSTNRSAFQQFLSRAAISEARR